MKHFSKLLILSFLTLITSVSYAQDKNHPWAITIGANAVDFSSTGASGMGNLFAQPLNARDNWNFVGSPFSYVNVKRHIADNISFGVNLSFNQIDRIAILERQTLLRPEDLSYYSADGGFSYSLATLISSKIFDPYINVGAGYTWIDNEGFATFNPGAGINFWLTDKIGVNLQTTYKYAFDSGTINQANLPSPIEEGISHWQHQLGLVFRFGDKDTDGDKIFDKEDACPEVPGLPQFKGCPDSDGDGIEDSKDACPNEAGLAEFNGCPDTDGDGIPNKEDACPTVAGLKALNGCPDADGDGIADKDDACPNQAGPKANKGCPWPDSDNDGVLDKDDQCPTVAGTVANNGCPEVSVDDVKKLNDYSKTILFDTGKASIQKGSLETLNAIAEIMKQYPNSKFSIDGHTDSVGSDALNLKLSEERAATVREYLTTRGLEGSRLESHGYGESRPIDSNNTAKGRKNNRRVEVTVIK